MGDGRTALGPFVMEVKELTRTLHLVDIRDRPSTPMIAEAAAGCKDCCRERATGTLALGPLRRPGSGCSPPS